MVRPAIKLFLAAGLLAATSAVGSAQEPEYDPETGEAVLPEPEQPYDEARARAHMEEVLREHDRVRHGGSAPPDTTGIEQGDNDLRGSTPALAKSSRTQPQVDLQELHERALAMYDGRARFTTATSVTGSGTDEARAKRPVRAAAKQEEAPERHSPLGLQLLFGSLIVVGGVVAWRSSRR